VAGRSQRELPETPPPGALVDDGRAPGARSPTRAIYIYDRTHALLRVSRLRQCERVHGLAQTTDTPSGCAPARQHPWATRHNRHPNVSRPGWPPMTGKGPPSGWPSPPALQESQAGRSSNAHQRFRRQAQGRLLAGQSSSRNTHGAGASRPARSASSQARRQANCRSNRRALLPHTRARPVGKNKKKTASAACLDQPGARSCLAQGQGDDSA